MSSDISRDLEDNNSLDSAVDSQEEQQPTSEYEAAEEVQEQAAEAPKETSHQAEQPAMSQEQMLLLQVLRRAKRQQDLIMQVQKSLKVLANIEKSMSKTSDQIKQLQSAARDSQRQIAQTQRQIAAVEKRVQKIATSKKGTASTAGKGSKGRKKSSRKQR